MKKLLENVLIIVNMLSIVINFLGVAIILVRGYSYLLIIGIILFFISSILLKVYYPDSTYLEEDTFNEDDGISI